jgi:putative restriction endonuclease
MNGISGTAGEGADSIVLSGGYEDDVDYGDVIIYTGQGGNDPETKKQVADQELHLGNMGLAKSCIEGLPVRVSRGERLDSPYRPDQGYRYDGLYTVDDFWRERGRSGYHIWRYRLLRSPGQPPLPTPRGGASVASPAPRVPTVVQRIARNTAAAQRVKEIHDHRCQVCGERLETGAGPYSEAAHVRPLGAPHDGPDVEDNILCLCPNDHVRFDYGGIAITDDLRLIDRVAGVEFGRLRTAERHPLSREHLAYHRGLAPRASIQLALRS